MKAICYISNFAENLSSDNINDLISYVNKNNNEVGITGLLIVRNKHFFQILEGKKEKVDTLFKKIKTDIRHRGVIKLLDIRIDDQIFKDYNSGKFEIFQGHIVVENSTEQQRYFIQHATGFQVHDRAHPHLPGRHGRSEEGWTQ